MRIFSYCSTTQKKNSAYHRIYLYTVYTFDLIRFYGKENGWAIYFTRRRRKKKILFPFSTSFLIKVQIFMYNREVSLLTFQQQNCTLYVSITMRWTKFNEFLIKKFSWKSHELCSKCVVFSKIYILLARKGIIVVLTLRKRIMRII